MSEDDLSGLPARLQNFEEAAYLEFADYFGPRFRAYFIEKGMSVTEAEELAVSCITDICLKIEKYRDGIGSFTGWVYTIIHNRYIDWLRKNELETIPLHDNFEEIKDPESTSRLIESVREAVGQLSKNDQEILQLRELGANYNYSEISQKLDISINAARTRHCRAVKRLGEILKQDHTVMAVVNKEKNR